MSDLERQYRAGMRFYTARWRQKNGDALLSTLMDAAEAEKRTDPTLTELRDLTRMGLRQRAIAVLPYVFFAIALSSVVILLVLSVSAIWSTNDVNVVHVVLPDHGDSGYIFPAHHPFVPSRFAYLATAALCLTCLALGIVTFRRNRRLLSP